MIDSVKDRGIRALAEVWASIDGRLDRFEAGETDHEFNDADGTFSGYMSESSEAVKRLANRGFELKPVKCDDDHCDNHRNINGGCDVCGSPCF